MKFASIVNITRAIFFVAVTLLIGQSAFAADAPVKVNVDNFVRAETASQIDRALKTVGINVNTWGHLRTPTPLDAQNVIRMNRDTLYSAALIDISKGATLTIPETGDRYLSIMVVNEDHYINKDSPGGGLESNWLPAPDGPFYMVLRLYGPEPKALEGKWTPPVLQKVD
jgi:hypothetical protein